MLGNYSNHIKKLGLAVSLVITLLLSTGLAYSTEESKTIYSGSGVDNQALHTTLQPCKALLADWLKMSSVTRSPDGRKHVDECYQSFLDGLIRQLSIQ